MIDLFAPPTDQEVEDRQKKRYAHFIATFDDPDDNRLILNWSPMLIETQKHIAKYTVLRSGFEETQPPLNAKEQLLLVRAWEDEVIAALIEDKDTNKKTISSESLVERLSKRLPELAQEHVSVDFRSKHNELIQAPERRRDKTETPEKT